MDFVIKFSARTATLFQTFARMPILFIFCKFYKVPSTKAANLVASFCFFQPQAPRFCEGPAFFRHRRQIFCLLLLLPAAGPSLLRRPVIFHKGGKSLCFLLLLPAAGPSLLQRPRFLSSQAANLLPPLASSSRRPSLLQRPRFLSPQAASLLPPLTSYSRSPSLLRSSRLYEVLAFIQKLTFEKKPKGSPLDKLETVWKQTEVIPANFHRPHSLEASPETCVGLKPPG